jgi:hypothetical protein
MICKREKECFIRYSSFWNCISMGCENFESVSVGANLFYIEMSDQCPAYKGLVDAFYLRGELKFLGLMCIVRDLTHSYVNGDIQTHFTMEII